MELPPFSIGTHPGRTTQTQPIMRFVEPPTANASPISESFIRYGKYLRAIPPNMASVTPMLAFGGVPPTPIRTPPGPCESANICCSEQFRLVVQSIADRDRLVAQTMTIATIPKVALIDRSTHTTEPCAWCIPQLPFSRKEDPG